MIGPWTEVLDIFIVLGFAAFRDRTTDLAMDQGYNWHGSGYATYFGYGWHRHTGIGLAYGWGLRT